MRFCQKSGIWIMPSSPLYVLLCTKSYFWVGEILLLEDAIAPSIAQSTHTVVISYRDRR